MKVQKILASKRNRSQWIQCRLFTHQEIYALNVFKKLKSTATVNFAYKNYQSYEIFRIILAVFVSKNSKVVQAFKCFSM